MASLAEVHPRHPDTSPLQAAGWRGRAAPLASGIRCLGSLGWQSIDDLTGSCVVQFLAGLVFDRVGIVLQAFNMFLQQFVLSLKALQLTIEALGLLPLLLIDRNSVLPKNDMVSQANSEQSCGAGRNLAPTRVTAFIETRQQARLFAFGLRRAGASHLQLSTKLNAIHGQVENPFTCSSESSSYLP